MNYWISILRVDAQEYFFPLIGSLLAEIQANMTWNQIHLSTFEFLNPTEGGQPMWLGIWGKAIVLAVGLSAVAIAMQR